MTDTDDVDRRIRALTEMIGTLAGALSRLSSRVDEMASDVQVRDGAGSAAWVWSSPSPAEDDDPQAVVDNFVSFYNMTYVGVEGGRAKPIPACWRQHSGLAMEVANLAYAWRAVNLGSAANPRDAQHWHQQWRPGFAERLAREWVHADCLDGAHR